MNKSAFVSIPLSVALFSGCAALDPHYGKLGGTVLGGVVGGVIGKEVAGDTGAVVGAIIGGCRALYR